MRTALSFLITVAACAAPSVDEGPALEEAGSRDDRAAAPRLLSAGEPLRCGATIENRLSNGGMFGALLGPISGTSHRYTVRATPGGTLTLEFSYRSSRARAYGVDIRVMDKADERVIASSRAHTQYHRVDIRTRATSSGWYEVRVEPITTLTDIDDDNDYESISEAYSLSASCQCGVGCPCYLGTTPSTCQEAVSCEASGGVPTPGLCPGAASIQCCAPGPEVRGTPPVALHPATGAITGPAPYRCTGTLIRQRPALIVTAAHCFRPEHRDRDGESLLDPWTFRLPNGETRSLARVISHDDFAWDRLHSTDVALALLDAPIDDVEPAVFAPEATCFSPAEVEVVGEGISRGDDISSLPRRQILLASSRECTHEGAFFDPGVDAWKVTNGDSGGPVFRAGSEEIVGIVVGMTVGVSVDALSVTQFSDWAEATSEHLER